MCWLFIYYPYNIALYIIIKKMDSRPYVEYRNTVLWGRVWKEIYWYQCVWLFKDYMDKVLWYKVRISWNANQIRTNKYWVFNTIRQRIFWMNDLMQGDIIISLKWTCWHIAIVDHIAWWKIFVLEQNGSWKNSGSWTGANAIRVQGYTPWFWVWVWRCSKIFSNLQLERKFIDDKLSKNPSDYKSTLDYKNSIRYIKFA